jgi:hypothetical protein
MHSGSQEAVARQHGARSSRQAVIFFTYLFDRSVQLLYRKLKTDLNGLADIFILAQHGTSIPDEHLGEVHFFNYERLRSMAAKVIGDKITPGNQHLAQLDFYGNHPGFDFYWFIEYDVVFTGNWATLLNEVQNDRADFLAAHIRSHAEEPLWPWWKTLDLPGCPLPKFEWLRSFVPVCRISRRGLRALDEHVKLGWSGHYEALIPCVIRSSSLAVADLGGAGKWTPRHRRHRFYSSYSLSGESMLAGTHRHRPPHYLPRLRRNTIFHPVKSLPLRSNSYPFYWGEFFLRIWVSSYYNLLSILAVFGRK